MSNIINSKTLKVVVALVVASFLFLGVFYTAKATSHLLTSSQCADSDLEVAIVALIGQSFWDDACGPEISGDAVELQAKADEIAAIDTPPYIHLSSDRGDDVQTIQEALMLLEYDLPLWGADAVGGGETCGAAKDLQGDAGISEDCVFGPDTAAAFAASFANTIAALVPPPPPLDSDNDGVLDINDLCPGTASGVNVDSDGCEVGLDTDGDGILDINDDDDDNDGVLDDGADGISGNADDDNCPLIANADQADDDNDLVGNLCDDDFTAPTGLTVALSADTPASKVVPLGSTSVPFFEFVLTGSSSGDTTVTQITIHRTDAGSVSDFISSGVYIYDGDNRLTSGRTINSNTNNATFTGLNLVVSQGSSKTLMVKADINTTTSGGVNAFEIVDSSSIQASSDFSADYPVRGNSISISSASAGSVTIERTGSNPLIAPKAGETGAKIAEFRVTTGSVEDIFMQRVALYQVGNIASSNLSNLKMYQAGNEIASASGIDSQNLITFVFDTPFPVARGDSRIFEVKGDVGGGTRANDTIRLYLDSNSDFEATGSVHGVGVAVIRTLYDNSVNNGSDASWSTVVAGEITNIFNGPATKDIANNAKDETLFAFSMSSAASVEVRQVDITFTANTPTGSVTVVSGITSSTDNDGLVDDSLATKVANYSDIKIVDVDSGQTIAGPMELSIITGASRVAQTILFTDVFNLSSGQTRNLEVRADIRNNTNTEFNDDTITVSLGAFGGSYIRNLDNNTFVATTDIVPSGTITGNAHNITLSSLTVGITSTPVSQTQIRGTSFDALGINLQAGTGGEITIQTITFTGYIDADGTSDFTQGCNGDGGNGLCGDATESDTVAEDILSATLWDGTEQVGTLKSPTSSAAEGSGGLIQFTNLNFPVPAGVTKTLTLKVNSAAGADTLIDRVKFGIANTSDITAVDAEGNSITPTNNATNGAAADSGVRMTIADTGVLSYAKGSDDTESETAIEIAGQTSQTLGKLRFTAQNEELKITRAQVELVNVGNFNSIISLRLYDGVTPVSSSVSMGSSGVVQFNDVDFLVPKDGSKDLLVKADLNTISGGATSGADIAVRFCNGVDSGTDTCGANEVFEARGTGNSSTVLLTSGTNDIDGNPKILRKSVLTFEKVDLGTTALINGTEQDIYKFTAKADGDSASIRQLIFGVTLTDNGVSQTLTADGWKLFRGSTDITSQVFIQDQDGTPMEGAGSFAEADTAIVVTWANDGLNGEETISDGSTNTYTLRATPTGYTVGAEDDSINVTLNADTVVQGALNVFVRDLDANATEIRLSLGIVTAAGASETANIIWSDNSAIPHSASVIDDDGTDTTSSDDYINGYLLKSTPLGGSTLNN